MKRASTPQESEDETLCSDSPATRESGTMLSAVGGLETHREVKEVGRNRRKQVWFRAHGEREPGRYWLR